MHLAETQKQAKELESVIIEKREGFMYALIGDCWHEGSGSRYFLTKILQAIQWGNDKLFNRQENDTIFKTNYKGMKNAENGNYVGIY